MLIFENIHIRGTIERISARILNFLLIKVPLTNRIQQINSVTENNKNPRMEGYSYYKVELVFKED
jgi:hypothetical protein